MCSNICKLCRRLILSQTVTFATDTLTVNLPDGSYRNREKYCLVLAQTIPDTATINAPVVVTIGTGTTTFPLLDCTGSPVTAGQLRTRTRYATRVNTTQTGGSFRLLGGLCGVNNDLAAITSET
uniref:Uncharacterized protein n=1 Tax=Myoviridae sp. ctk6V34 TaxID=2825164 RepID=A0A8S5V3H4_9CAUD|nr:MAG TPA: hypothetical protein [Myoviridae sp. ctk6V34]